MIEFDDYDPERDLDAVRRIWEETGWRDPSSKDDAESMDSILEASRGWVARMNGEAECLVLCISGELRYLKEDLPHSAVAAVTTSRIGRKRGLASRLTARAIAEESARGALLSGLGMFEQGYYDRLGFGTGPYDHIVYLDPRMLNVPTPARPPIRLTRDDRDEIHACRLSRLKAHGSVTFHSPQVTWQHMLELAKGFGLGYRENGRLTHHFWCRVRHPEHGPYEIAWLSYETPEQLVELLGTLKLLGDQVRVVEIVEPVGIQLQDLVHQPLQSRMIRRNSKFETGIRSVAHWQIRICDLPGSLAKTKLPCDELRFQLQLRDPIEEHLNDDAPWKGTGGTYIITLGAQSCAEGGEDGKLPKLTATVNAFTRMWLGVRPATGLAVTDELAGPKELLEQLDAAFRLPKPYRDWMF